jgi:type I restriction enzyme S subunit
LELLREQREVVVNSNVTCDPMNVESDWDAMRLGRVIDLLTGFPFESQGFSQSPNDIRLLRGINVSPGRIRWDNVVRWPSGDRASFAKYELEPGDIILGLDRPLIQAGTRVALVDDTDVPALLLQRVGRIRPTGRISKEFLLLVFQARNFADYLSTIFTGISVPHLSPEQIKTFELALPPVPEQREIVARVAAHKAGIDAATAHTARLITAVREYWTRLVSDVVTGQLDVREAAASLPDEPDEPDELSLAGEILDEADDADLEMEDLAEEVAE